MRCRRRRDQCREREILDHKTDSRALTVQNGSYINNGQTQDKKTTIGWKLECEFSDGTTDWISLKDLKNSNPIQLAEYAIMNKIDHKPAFFRWWVPFVMRKRDRMINKVKKRSTGGLHISLGFGYQRR